MPEETNYAREAVRLNATVPDGYALVPVEPIIAMCMAGDAARLNTDDATRSAPCYCAMLAAAPQTAQQPLTDEQIYNLYRRAGLEAYHMRDDVVQHAYDKCINDFVRAIERTHGIGVKT